jgi:hypothetical protein
MTRDDIIKLMNWHPSIVNDGPNSLLSKVERAIRAAEAAEREACAQVCERRYMGDNNREDMEARRCADAIRARGEK